MDAMDRLRDLLSAGKIEASEFQAHVTEIVHREIDVNSHQLQSFLRAKVRIFEFTHTSTHINHRIYK